MPTAPYAKLLVSVDGGAPTSGAVTAEVGDMLQFSIENPTGVTKGYRWVLYDFPPDMEEPDGWNTDPNDGTYFSLAATPDPVEVTHWGKILPALYINGATHTSSDPRLRDESTGIKTLSPAGAPGVSGLERQQFNDRGFTVDLHKSLMAMETVGGVTIDPSGFEVVTGTTPQTSLASTDANLVVRPQAYATTALLRAAPVAIGRRYQGPDGRIWVGEATGANVDNIGTVLVGGGGAKKYTSLDGLIDAKWFGTAGDDTTDDTAALNACADACAALRDTLGARTTMFLPKCTAYKITAGVVVGHGIGWLQEAPIRTSGLGFTALTLGSTTLSQEIDLHGIWVEHTAISTAWAATEATEGVRIINKSTGDIYIRRIEGFYTGCTYFGDSNGFVYTNTTLGIFRDNKQQLVLSSQGSGYCNENKFYGGEFFCSSARESDPHVGVVITAVAGHRYQTGNVFFGPSFELQEPDPLPADPADEVNTPLLIEYGLRNGVIRYRSELNGNQFCKVLNSSNVYIEGMSSGGKIVDQSTSADSVNYGDLSRDRLKGLFPFAIFNLAERFVDMGNGSAAFRGMSVSRTGMATEEPLELYDGFSLSADKSAVDFANTNIAVGVMVDTSVTKRFAVSRAMLTGTDPTSGRTVIRAYDAGGNNVSSTDIAGEGTFSSAYLSPVGCRTLLQDLGVIRVTAAVQRIWVGVSIEPTSSLILYADPVTRPPQTYGYLPRKRTSFHAGTTYTFIAGDDAYLLHRFQNAGATTVTIAPDATYDFPDETEIEAYMSGAGVVSFVGGAGVTIESLVGATPSMAGIGARVKLFKRGTNYWVISGDIV